MGQLSQSSAGLAQIFPQANKRGFTGLGKAITSCRWATRQRVETVTSKQLWVIRRAVCTSWLWANHSRRFPAIQTNDRLRPHTVTLYVITLLHNYYSTTHTHTLKQWEILTSQPVWMQFSFNSCKILTECNQSHLTSCAGHRCLCTSLHYSINLTCNIIMASRQLYYTVSGKKESGVFQP